MMLQAIKERVMKFAEAKLPALTRYKKAEPLPVILHHRRVYILPTRFGLFFAFVLTVMLLGALNFNNNAAILFTMLLAGVVVISMHRSVANLRGIGLEAIHARPVHAGDLLKLELHFSNPNLSRRHRVQITLLDAHTIFDLPADVRTVMVPAVSKNRGWLRPGRIRLHSEYPFGWFWCWSIIHPEAAFLIYPEAESKAPPLPETGSAKEGRYANSGGDDLYALREYRDGDPIHQVAWKASAKQDRLLIKEFRQPRGGELSLDWSALSNLPNEKRISRLTRWVLDAHAASRAYRLVLPHIKLGPARDSDHLHRCLRELSLLPGAQE